VPEPYEMSEDASIGLTIRHRPFNARLPASFQTKRDVQEAFASLLMGATQPGYGDFTYRGQPMLLCDPIAPGSLPPRPLIESGLEPASWVYSSLGNVVYEPGFTPISEPLFSCIKNLDASWSEDRARANKHAHTHVAKIWQRTQEIRFGTLDDRDEEVPEYGQQDFAELRLLYPELSMLSDGSLYGWFDVYQMECCFINGWTASRDNDFLFYLLGKVVGRHFEGESATRVGAWVAYALLRGDSIEDSIAFAQAAALYDSALATICNRTADAMRFLANDKTASGSQGRPITTMMDMFRAGRSFNAKPVLVEQNFAEFRKTLQS
jgi:hypothetical protein